MTMERVERRLRASTSALDGAGIPYAVVGGNAVAVWVAKSDPAATRTTKDVDILVRRSDLDGVTAALEGIGFHREDLRSITLFVDPDEPSRKSGVHLVWAGERVRSSYSHAAPEVEEAVRDAEGFLVLGIEALVRMKLTSLRAIDRVHVGDLLGAGLVTDEVRRGLPDDLRARLDEIARDVEEEGLG